VPCGVAPSRWRFLQRNRLIAAATGATVVVEAGWRSGSINTAHHAAQLARPVGVVPGPVTSSASAGCHRLLRESDAICVTTAAEMAQLLGDAAPLDHADSTYTGATTTEGATPSGGGDSGDRSDGTPSGSSGSDVLSPASASPRSALADPNGTRVRLLDALSTTSGRDPVRLAVISGLAPDRIRAELGLLELDGLVRRRPSGWVRAFSRPEPTR
jgi:DNA processing protein